MNTEVKDIIEENPDIVLLLNIADASVSMTASPEELVAQMMSGEIDAGQFMAVKGDSDNSTYSASQTQTAAVSFDGISVSDEDVSIDDVQSKKQSFVDMLDQQKSGGFGRTDV